MYICLSSVKMLRYVKWRLLGLGGREKEGAREGGRGRERGRKGQGGTGREGGRGGREGGSEGGRVEGGREREKPGSLQ